VITDTPVLEQLRALGTEQACKTYRRHGVREEVFGVSYADLGKLAKRIKVNHALALELWASGVHDARVLATMIADPRQADDATLEAWAADLDNYVISDALTSFVVKTPLARHKMEEWTRRTGREWIAAVGWNVLGGIALRDTALPESYFQPYLASIERDIHTSLNRVRYAMNNTLIAIGGRSPVLREQATAAARRIGPVQVDHGRTGCKTPDAVSYIDKMWQRRT
jgi:3-methyladenine DNA glycosylase AlkD